MNVDRPSFCRNASLALALALMAAAVPAAAAGEIVAVAHRLEVELVLRESRLIGRDRMRIAPSGRTELAISLSERARRVRVAVNGSDREFQRFASVLRVPLQANERGREVRVDLAYEAVFDEPIPVNPLNTDNPGFGVAASITAQGVFLLGGAGWYPDLADSRPTFRLTAKAPPGVLAVTAGRSLGHIDRDGATVSEWQIDHPVRGLALSAAAYRVQERTVGDIVIATYFTEPNQDLAPAYLEATAGYLRLYERLFGPYPFPKFAVVENFFPTGYGFPSYTLIGDTVLRLPFIIATSLGHEIAHCWWGNGVFVDFTAGNWSEGLTTYVADYLYKERESPEEARSARLQMIRNYTTLAPPQREVALARFASRTDTVSKAVGYDKAAMVFHMLRREVGEEPFWGGLRDLYASHLFRPASWADIQQAVEARSGRSLEWFFEQWVRRPGAPRLRLEGIRARTAGAAWTIDGMLVQEPPHFRGAWDVVVDNGARIETHPIELTGGSATFSLAARQRPIGIGVDPESHWLRRLDASEIPPAVNFLKSSPGVTLVLAHRATADPRRIADILIRSLGLKGPVVVSEDELGPALESGRDLILVGLPREPARLPSLPAGVALGPERFTVDRETFARRDEAFFGVFRHPRSAERVMAVLLALGPNGAESAAGKLTHYGRYGFLAFRNGANTVKGSWPPEPSPLAYRWTSAGN
ncbi:MAG: M1 family aminopeptidase [Desulfobacterales bacterium]